MAWLSECHYDDVLQCRDKDSGSEAQRRVANGVWVEMTLAAESRVLAQTNRTYYKPAMILGKLIWTIMRRTSFPRVSLERRHVLVSVAPQLKH
jgi:hypothetical protein